ncbi:biotin--[acetyl-CoA-carboxylase] ligase [Gemmobacter lutimaris]|uniref:biotin--[biotin carboxyl-carrier protein] ligase n=1 Tax=Gemmobacter lutimaris TaxID=2306023 RepID=A0A398BYB9_9RHOB|nr:biotin--[acetyl-CoA-carboxylase] ligase [Gemmobacter lutimaris]RID93861.1 biotin--[acetyl-CoA-carboxylase] ligase [Gemmobacter lutimaris]
MSGNADPVWPEGVARHALDTVDSTNAYALSLMPGLTGPAWVIAGEQTAGRGRRGRPWSSPRGNFYGSLVMRPEGPPEMAALRSFIAALALYDACVGLTDLPGAFALKWPNDVLLNGGKLAGILLESGGAGGRVSHLIIGIGVNLIGAPPVEAVEPGAVTPVSLLAETGLRITPERFLTHLAAAFAVWEARFQAEGFAPIRAAWLDRAARRGERIRARTGTAERHGIFETIDDSGALVLNIDGRREAIPAAEVFF